MVRCETSLTLNRQNYMDSASPVLKGSSVPRPRMSRRHRPLRDRREFLREERDSFSRSYESDGYRLERSSDEGYEWDLLFEEIHALTKRAGLPDGSKSVFTSNSSSETRCLELQMLWLGN